jgi:AcrR family transcriptional regulator
MSVRGMITTASAAPAAPAGLRERKKQQTRLAISDVATRLFIERGFDHVTLAEVATAANVSVNTIFNYFASKEELFFDRGEEVAEEPSRIVRVRRQDESVIDAIRRVYLAAIREHTGLFQSHIKPFVATIEATPALKLRERLLYDQGEQRLVQTLLDDPGVSADEATARVVAALITSVQWMLFREFRVRLLRDEPETKIRAALVRTAERAFAVLDAGCGPIGRPVGRPVSHPVGRTQTQKRTPTAKRNVRGTV